MGTNGTAQKWIMRRKNGLQGRIEHLRSASHVGIAYLGALLGKRVVAAATAVAAVFTILNAFRGSHDQIVLSARWWLIATVAGVILGQFLVWRDLWVDEVARQHGEELRASAVEVRDALV